MSELVEEINEVDFAKKVDAKEGYVLVDFWAPWCGPCRIMSPIIDELAKDNGDKITFYKANVDVCGDISARFRVLNIPCFMLFKDGKVIATKVGGSSKEAFVEWLKDNTKFNIK